MPRATLQMPIMREVGVSPRVDFALQLDIKLVQQLFLVREIGEERARGEARSSGHLRPQATQSDLGNLVDCRVEDDAAFLSTSDSCHTMDESTVVRRLESRQ